MVLNTLFIFWQQSLGTSKRHPSQLAVILSPVCVLLYPPQQQGSEISGNIQQFK